MVIADGAVNQAATDGRRAGKSGEAANAFYDYGAGRDEFEQVWTEANYAALTELLQALPVHWRFFVKHRVFEAVEKLDAAVRKGDGSEIRAVFGSILPATVR